MRAREGACDHQTVMSARKQHVFSKDRAPEGSPSPEPVERMVLCELVEIRDKLKVDT